MAIIQLKTNNNILEAKVHRKFYYPIIQLKINNNTVEDRRTKNFTTYAHYTIQDKQLNYIIMNTGGHFS